ncbi:hypothetical protein MTO96_040134 [Rhipicephalus appendiculatus]
MTIYYSRKVFFVDHGFQYLPPRRVLAADGLHPSFEGVALMASHIRELFFKHSDNDESLWRDFACVFPAAVPPRLLEGAPLSLPQTSTTGLQSQTIVTFPMPPILPERATLSPQQTPTTTFQSPATAMFVVLGVPVQVRSVL